MENLLFLGVPILRSFSEKSFPAELRSLRKKKESYSPYNFIIHPYDFRWLNPFMKKGYGKTLEVEDMFNACPEDKSEILGDNLEKY